MVRTLNGPAFSRVLRAGALAVVREQESLNRINVFPVRDADTGANLAATLKAAAARLGSASPDGVGAAARVAADGALDGARGNSGAIFAQFLHGLAGGMERRSHVDGPQFADAARLGTESAYAALQDPREGTILSVLKAWSHELGRRSGEEDFTEMMHGGLVAAREALADTPRQLEVLARNHVVDAGGQGFVYFLEGIIESLRGRETAWVPIEAPPHGLPPFSLEHDEIDERFRYCTEALLTPRDAPLSRDAVMAAVLGLGESLVVAGGDQRLRVHIHTNEPQKFLATVAALGAVEHSKIDDMVLQQLAGREATIALVTDSTTDLPEDIAFRLGVVAVPLTLTLGDESYLDGVDITLDGFIHRVTSGTRSAALVAAGGGRLRADLPPSAGVPRGHRVGAHRGGDVGHRAVRAGGGPRGRPGAHQGHRLLRGLGGRRPAARGRRRGHRRRRRPGRGGRAARAGEARDPHLRHGRVARLRRARRAPEPQHGAHR